MIKILKSSLADSFDFSAKNHTFLNPYSYLLARKEQDLFAKFDYIHIDGIALVIFLKLVGVKTVRRSFDMTSMAPLLFKHCEEKAKTIYFIGAKDEEVENSVTTFQESYPQMKIAGCRNGYLNKEGEWDKAINEIIEKNPDFVVVGMGTPIQEKFLIDLQKKGFKGSGFTCGGFLHQSQDDIDYYPAFFDKFNLRWLYRMIDEPKLIKRYGIDYPFFVLCFVWDILTKK
ncbi:MAG: WecB/TagA/CpsF family glycosyltransferase [Cytophagales bacterium]|nr:WecB/TagA/CpsF family glycosyltransferase [Cytophagales bacterium]